ncbi:MAG: type VI secretion system lipoprotein TssJ [Burkholderiaceae bacterium]|nr:type VI secretion system lipoprotein TssJ [Burkholderiaceae bacterium]
MHALATSHRDGAAGPGTARGGAGNRGRVRRLALATALALAAGCATKPAPTRLEGSIVAAADLNPSVSGRPSPLILRVYELRSETAFNQADFMSLYQSDQATLGAELVAREEVMLQPGQTRPLARALDAQTRFVGVFAAYRDLERAVWRASVAVRPGKANRLTIRAQPLAVSAAAQP